MIGCAIVDSLAFNRIFYFLPRLRVGGLQTVVFIEESIDEVI